MGSQNVRKRILQDITNKTPAFSQMKKDATVKSTKKVVHKTKVKPAIEEPVQEIVKDIEYMHRAPEPLRICR